MENLDKAQQEYVVQMLEDLSEKQAKIDKKTKTSEEYKELCEKLIEHNNLTHIIFGILVLIYLLVTTFLIYNTAIPQ